MNDVKLVNSAFKKKIIIVIHFTISIEKEFEQHYFLITSTISTVKTYYYYIIILKYNILILIQILKLIIFLKLFMNYIFNVTKASFRKFDCW